MGGATPARLFRVGGYTVYTEFASGGMATVHLARAVSDAGVRVVAVKRLLPHLRAEEDFAVHLLDEARLASCVRHEAVVEALDVARTDDELLLVMEYIDGPSLTEIMRAWRAEAQGGLPVPAAVTIAISILRGLHAAHVATDHDGRPLMLVHRDVSPQNVLLTNDGVAKIADFGIAKSVGRLRSTRDGALKGKIAYMSPEQVAGEPLDARSDVYSLAVVLWEMLAGRPMFEGETDVELFGRVMRGGAAEIASIVPGVPAGIARALARGLSRDRRRRHASAEAFADALAAELPADLAAVRAVLARIDVPRVRECNAFVAELLRVDADVGDRAVDAAAPETGATDAVAASKRAPRAAPLARVGAFVLGTALVALVAAYVMWRDARAQNARVEPQLELSSASNSVSAPVPVPEAVPESTAATTGVAPAAPPIQAPVVAGGKRRAPSASGRPAPRASASAVGGPGCNPPWFVDSEGVRHFNKECFR